MAPPESETTAIRTSAGARTASNYSSTTDTTEHDTSERAPTNLPGLFWHRLGALELENKGSVARDHLALERTFLAWLRTSLAFASIGIAVTQLFRLNTSTQSADPNAPENKLKHVGKPLGVTFLGIAVLVLMIGVNRYYESQAWLLEGKFPASRGSVFLLTAVAAAVSEGFAQGENGC